MSRCLFALVSALVFFAGLSTTVSAKQSEYQCHERDGPVYFNALLTPIWLRDNAQIYEPVTISNEALLINNGPVDRNRLIRVRLVKPGVLRDERRYIVTIITSHVSPVSPTTDKDLEVYVSDGANAVGHLILDQANFAADAPIWSCQTVSGPVSSRTCVRSSVRVSTASKPAEVVTAVHNVGGNQPAAGEAHAAYDRDISVFHTYTKTLRPSRGLYLEVYRDHKAEKYLIRFIKVKVEEELTS